MRSNGYNKYGINHLEQAEDSIIKQLAKTTDFMTALNTEIGRVLFADLVALLDEKFKLIYEEKASDVDRAMFSACKEIGRRWNKKIDSHSKNTTAYKQIDEFKKNTESIRTS